MPYPIPPKTLFIILALSICKNINAQENNFQHYQIDIHGKRHDFFEFIEHVEIIPLEETEQSLLSRVEAYFPTPNGIGIIDRKNNQVQLFNKAGKYLNTINRFGEGPEEYRNLVASVWVENNKIKLFSSLSRSVLTFNLQGTYLKTTPVNYPEEIWGGSLTPYNHGYVVQMLDRSKAKRSNYELMFLDKNLKDLSFASPRPNPHPFPVNMGNRFSYINQQLIWKKRLSDSIFFIKENKPIPLMRFDFGEDWTWNNPNARSKMKLAFHEIWREEAKVWEVLSKVNEQYVLTTYKYTVTKDDKGLIDRKSGKFYRLDTRKEDGENFNLYFLEWENDRLTTSLQAYDVEEFLENLGEDQYSIAGGLKYEDFAFSENPVLLRIKFKVPD
ncbi:6-bladed beta-propeller protein [Roseivirga pacifica]|uniref:6-bladed beta-propeller protein n=1 Tax=Roseivirga pacifica TaxID=1267423 RepID=A0A1I0QYG8_9BACT|nr:6-bladed beta-propeller [Roseivirga pacifica]RKQ42335.1 6-bladed beta-propeller protein [Roseivirga pacifica]SEW32917.1 6-bladed beta-propeller protein [Roseivirga pacifica]